jgi:hypothetical protein
MGVVDGDVIFKLLGEYIITIDKPEFSNAFIPIPPLLDVIEIGIVIEVNTEQLLNADAPIVVTELPNTTDDNVVQLWNVDIPILVAALLIMTFVNAVQLWNAFAPILVTDPPIITDVKVGRLSIGNWVEGIVVVEEV